MFFQSASVNELMLRRTYSYVEYACRRNDLYYNNEKARQPDLKKWLCELIECRNRLYSELENYNNLHDLFLRVYSTDGERYFPDIFFAMHKGKTP